MIKVGLIGTGFMGGTHAECYAALAENEYFKVTAVADIERDRAEKTAKKFGAKVFKSGMELIEKGDVNTVDICLPTYLHTEHALKAMEKGFNVFIEKPVCLKAEEADKLSEMQSKTGAKVAVGHCIRFWQEYVYLKKLVDNKTHGELVSGVFKRVSPRPSWGWKQWLVDEKRSGSAALDLHIHDVDFVRYILGSPDSIKCDIVKTDGNSEHIFSIYRYGNAVVSLEGGWGYPSDFPFEMEYRVKFDKATAVFSSTKNPSLTIYEEDGTTVQPIIEKEFDSQSEGLGGNIASLGGYYSEIKYFLECLRDDRELTIAPLKEGIASFRLLLKEFDAAK